MNDTAIKNYATWARRELIADVQKRCMRYGILEEDSLPANADTIDGRVLTLAERTQRAELLRIAREDGYRELVERAAYTWFNRLLAIRFMEVNDRLPSHIRVLSAPDGSFKPQAIAEAMDLPLEALDPAQVAELVQAGNDEDLFRAIFLAQCDELASCMPAVFDKVGSAMELLLPDGLLREGGVVEQLVNAIPEQDWTEGVEIVGWMYQYYVSERKDEVFASFKKGKKAERDAIAPATQLFTPNWIVHYLTENSLGRLWMLNRPDSSLSEDMPYFVKPDEDHEIEFKHVDGPEDIIVVDPACGSGHILVYAFELLAKMYAEDGYTGRDAARLILEKNLSGMEIDPRAGAMASFALTMKACELDSRFLRRGVSPRITVLSRVEFDGEEQRYIENLRNRPELMDAAAHLDECGSLLTVSKDDLEAVARDLASLAGEGSIFGGSAAEKLERLLAELEPLSCRYDVVVANPPYMGSSNMNKWLTAWVKSKYKEVYRDLCTCFIKRGMSLAEDKGYEALITSDTCMYISSFERMRKMVIDRTTIVTFIDTRGTNAHPDVFDANAGWVLWNHHGENVLGAYFKLNHPITEKGERLLEALANPDCGWFYKQSCSSFEAIPGSPIAYWISLSTLSAFTKYKPMRHYARTSKGLITGDNDEFFRLWWEISHSKIGFEIASNEQSIESGLEWFPLNKGGKFRKWYGNNEFVIHWANDGQAVHKHAKETGHHSQDYDSKLKFKDNISWSDISSGLANFRYRHNELSDHKGMPLLPITIPLKYCLGFLNSSTCAHFLSFLSPTLSCNIGEVEKLPVNVANEATEKRIEEIVSSQIADANEDWNSFEESWNFAKHPLI